MFPFFRINNLKRKKMDVDYYRGPMFCLVSYNYKTSEYLCIEKYKIYAIFGALYLIVLFYVILDLMKCLRNFYKLVMS